MRVPLRWEFLEQSVIRKTITLASAADQHLHVTVNGAAVSTDITLPFTIGMWRKTRPVEVSLVKGTNVLRFSRHDPLKGLTIKDFTLTPLK